MKKIINIATNKIGFLFCLFMLSFLGNAQVTGAHFTVSLADIASTSNTMEFDLMVTVDGPTEGIRFSGITSGINFNPAVLNGGSVTLTYLGQRSTAINGIVINTLNTATVGHMRIVGSPLTPATSIDIPVGSYKIGRYRLTNTASWAENSNAQLWFQPVVASGKSNNIINAGPLGQTSGGAYAYTTTAPSTAPGVGFGTVSQANPLAYFLNANCGISAQPVNPTICKAIGGTASVSVTATGTAGATFQWFTQTATGTTWTAIANNANYSGANTATLNITRTTTTTPAVGTKFRVVINGGICNNVTSDTVILQEQTVLSKGATITARSASLATLTPALTTCQGTSVVLSLAAGSIGNIQWQSSTDGINYTNVGSPIMQTALSALNPIMTLNSGILTQDTWFRVVASNGICSSVNSTATKITVSSPAVAGTISGGDVTVCAFLATGSPLDTAGNLITLPYTNSTTMTINGNNGTVLWQRSTNFMSATPTWSTVTTGIVGNQLTVTNLTADTWYRAIVTNGACKATTAVTKITVNKAAKAGTITSTTNSAVTTSVCTGGNITFTSAPYVGTSIQWELSTTSATSGFAPVSGQTGLVYTINNVSFPPLSKFYVRTVVLSGDCTLARSSVRTITVNPLSVAGTVTGGGTLCANGGATVRAAGYVGTPSWEYSLDGVNYLQAPYWKTVNFVPTYFNPNNTTQFSTAASTGIAATYVFTGLTSNVYFRARIKSGACSEVYTNAVYYQIGTAAVAGTISAGNSTICPSTGTTLTLSGSVGAIQWQRSAVSATTGLPGAFANISGQVGTTLNTGNLTASTAYQAVVTIGACSTVTTAYFIVNVVAKPVAKTITGSVTSPTGASATLALCTTDTSKVLTIGAGYTGSIQWQTSTTSTTTGFTNISGETGVSYTVTNPAVGPNYFRASFTNSCGVVVFSSAITVHYKSCVSREIAEDQIKSEFNVVAYPNPYSETFNLSLTTAMEDKVSVMVYDMTGKLIEQREVSPINVSELQVGDRYPSGIYNVIVTQGSEVKSLRVIKR